MDYNASKLKNINMKQLLFLLLFPAFALAQYPGNANQKITLGEQTTADGLIFRGIAADTTLTVKSDTAAYFVLDTVNLNLYTYKASASGRKWRQLGADTAAIAYVNTYGTQTVNGAKTFTSALTATRFNPTGTSATGNGMYLPATNTLGFSTNGTKQLEITSTGAATFSSSVTASGVITGQVNGNTFGTASASGRAVIIQAGSGNQSIQFKNSSGGDGTLFINGTSTSIDYNFNTYSVGDALVIKNNGNVGIGTASLQSGYRLHVVDSVYVGGNVSASAYTTRSDYDLKDEIQNINYGINEVMQMQPVKYTYKSNGSTQLGFIAQDLGIITPEVVSFEDKMSVYYNALIPILTKAIQEQQALIKALEQRIINLENK